jgi:hypothetical protein
MSELPKIIVSPEQNYIAAFPALSSGLDIYGEFDNASGPPVKRSSMTGRQWTDALNRFVLREDLPITLQCGEPSLNDDLFFIVNNLRSDIRLVLNISLHIDFYEFIKNVSPERLRRDAQADIRANFNPSAMGLDEAIKKIQLLKGAGFNVGLYMVTRPDAAVHEPEVRKKCEKADIPVTAKDIIGIYDGKLYGTLKWEGCCGGAELKNVLCRTNGILIAPDGNVYRCHHDLYHAVDPVVHVLSPYFPGMRKFIPCDHFGRCFPCDADAAPRRSGDFGRASVDVIFQAEPSIEDGSF